MTSKPIVHMYKDGSDIPFDVKLYRAVPFRTAHPNDLTAAQAVLKDAVTEATDEHHKVDNPVTRARGVQQVKNDATPAEALLLTRIEELEARVQAMKGLPAPPRELIKRAIPLPGTHAVMEFSSDLSIISYAAVAGEATRICENMGLKTRVSFEPNRRFFLHFYNPIDDIQLMELSSQLALTPEIKAVSIKINRSDEL